MRNSSSRISPGVIEESLAGMGAASCRQAASMVVDDLNVVRVAVGPPETDAPLLVDPDRVLSGPVTSERFQAIARRLPQVVEPRGRGEHLKLSPRDPLDRLEPPDRLVAGQTLGVAAPKRAYHVRQSLFRFP